MRTISERKIGKFAANCLHFNNHPSIKPIDNKGPESVHKSERGSAATEQGNRDGRLKFIELCTRYLGGFYRANGTIESCHLDDAAENNAIDVGLADLAQRTQQRVRHQELLRQVNLEAVLERVSDKIPNNVSINDLDLDWATAYFDFAKDATNDSMRELWANALVNEISRPGTISKCSLKFLHSLDTWEVTAFKRVAAAAFIGENGHPFVFRSVELSHLEDPLFSEIRMLSHCVSAGLVKATPSPLVVDFNFLYQNEKHTVTSDRLPSGSEVGYYVQKFTKIGSDLYRMTIDARSQSSVNIQQKAAWDYLCDFIEIIKD